jgi:NADH-quinone oxidoreductase subunit L
LENRFDLIWLVLGLPLAGFLLQCLAGKAAIEAFGPQAGRRVLGALAVAPVAAAFGVAVYLTALLASAPPAERAVVVTAFDWISLHSLRIPFELRVDPLSMTMALIITGVGALIHLYATGYMAEERDYSRFFCYMNLFVAFMLLLVLGNNLALLFIGWEGVGLCSYLLIGFWYKDRANARAANKAFIVNRIGDWGLTLGIFLLAVLLLTNREQLGLADPRWLSFDVLLPNLLELLRDEPEMATAIGLLLFVGAAGKSAQFPLYFWLPDAMAGPTPVSALIHAATMVTAGVYLLNRMHVVFEASPVASAVVAGVGAFTALFAALIAFGQMDIKKVLAYSTVSQLGFMFVACGAGAFWVGMFHVTTHAFFKALLFLGAGAVIHAMLHCQDMRAYGGLARYLPVTTVTMLAGWLAIAGFPYMSGFFSKEYILGGALAGGHAVLEGVNVGAIAGWTGLFVAFLTALYMTRLTFLTFFGGQERWRAAPDHAPAAASHEAPGEPHVHMAHEAHGEDEHGFFYSDEEARRRAAEDRDEHHHAPGPGHTPREVPFSMWFPLVVLAVLSVAGGWFLYSGKRLERWLVPEPLAVLGEAPLHPPGVPLLALSIAAALGGLIAGALWYARGLPQREGWDPSAWNPFRRAAAGQFGFDKAMTEAGVVGGGMAARGIWRVIDEGLIDGLVNLVGAVTKGLGGLVRQVQTGYVRGYALMMLFGGVSLLGYLAWALMRGAGGEAP